MSMTTAEQLFVEVWNRLTHDWSRVTTFRQMGVLGEDAARDAIHRSNTYFVQQQLLNGEHSALLKDRDAFICEGHAERIPYEMTENSVRNFRQTLHAATLVFAHSILDAAVFDCARICSVAEPLEWASFVENRKVTLGEVAAKSYANVLLDAIQLEVARLERESLLTKVDRVFQVCRPQKLDYLTNGFRFDRDRLVRLDDLRHKVVHAPDGNWTFDSIYEDMQFMQSSGIHIFSMVGERFGLRFSGEEAMKALATRGSLTSESSN